MYPVPTTIKRFTRVPLALGQEGEAACQTMAVYRAMCRDNNLYDPLLAEEKGQAYAIEQCAGRQRVQCAIEQESDVQKAHAKISPADMEKQAKQMEKAVKQAAIEGAVLNMGMQLALNAIPVVGNAISSLAGAITSYTSSKYKKRLENHVKKKQAELKAWIKKKQGEYNRALDAAYQKAYKDAAPLAVSNQPLKVAEEKLENILNPLTSINGLNGLDGLGFWSKMSGHDMWTEGRDRVNAMMAQKKKELTQFFDPMIAKSKEEGFRVLLAKKIAIEIRKSPQFIAIARSLGVPPPSHFIGPEQVTVGGPTLRQRPLGSTSAKPLPHTQTSGLKSTGAKALSSRTDQKLQSTSDQLKWMKEEHVVPKETNLLPWVAGAGAAIGLTLLVT